jgi:hypothetical protein
MKIKAFHGSSLNFNNFKLGTEIKNPTYGGVTDSGLGIFLTNSLLMAEWFAQLVEFSDYTYEYEKTGNIGYVYSVDLVYNKPLILENKDEKYEDSVQEYFKLIELAGGVEKLRSILLKSNYDCIILKYCTTNYYSDGTYTIYVALNPEQVKITDKNEYN